jgi:hypothetical protein
MRKPAASAVVTAAKTDAYGLTLNRSTRLSLRTAALGSVEANRHRSIKLRLRFMDIYIPPVEFPGLRMDERDFVF